MRISPRRCLLVLVLCVFLVVFGAACADSGVGRTVAPSPDGLDCVSDDRVSTIAEPAPEFAGHASPEDAIRSIATIVSVDGTPRHVEGATWIVVSDNGLAIARTRVEPWRGGWWAGEIVACGNGAEG